jgi:hypothetical protein
MRWKSPPGWPRPPAGWMPHPYWQPDPSWPAAPYGWQFWTPDLPPRRRPGFRGWCASMLPAAPTTRRPGDSRFSARRCWAEALGVYVLFFGVGVGAAALSEAGQTLNSDSPSIADSVLEGFQLLTEAGLAIVVVVALTRLRGLRLADLGWSPTWRTHRAYGWQALGIGLIFLAAILASSALLTLVSPSSHYPYGGVDAWNLLYELPHAINAGIIEELVVVALFVTALEQARTPVWVIYVVGITIRLSYHIYYGPGVITFVLWAAAAIWLFRRTRRITPLIVAHVLYDSSGVFFREVTGGGAAAVGVLLSLAIWALLITVIVRAIQIGTRGRKPPVGSSPAGPSAGFPRDFALSR